MSNFNPLYAKVKKEFIGRIARGEWSAGFMLPSEIDLAKELDVSQGTVRKALDEMTLERLLYRRQGVGTFVSTHDEERILFQFFKVKPIDGTRAFPDSFIIKVEKRIALENERKALNLMNENDEVIKIIRLRSINGIKALIEDIILPAKLFPQLELGEIPNNLYRLFSNDYGVTITNASEQIKAVNADSYIAEALGIKEGEAILKLDRTALTINGKIAEWRISYCRSDVFHYLSELR